MFAKGFEQNYDRSYLTYIFKGFWTNFWIKYDNILRLVC